MAKKHAAAGAADRARIPEMILAPDAGAITVAIEFGQAQHGAYTIQLFDAAGDTERFRKSGVNTDQLPDRFDLAFPPRDLDRGILVWSGAVDAFPSEPGQRYAVIMTVSQAGQPVGNGRIEKSGPLTTTQAFYVAARLVLR